MRRRLPVGEQGWASLNRAEARQRARLWKGVRYALGVMLVLALVASFLPAMAAWWVGR